MIDLEEVRADLAALDGTDHSSAVRVAAHVPALLAEVERLREALTFYAEDDNWWAGPGVGRDTLVATTYIQADQGEIARKALG